MVKSYRGMLEAGAMPMVALTGLESLTFAARGAGRFQSPNTTVLVLGGSGGTGHMGIQLAKARRLCRWLEFFRVNLPVNIGFSWSFLVILGFVFLTIFYQKA